MKKPTPKNPRSATRNTHSVYLDHGYIAYPKNGVKRACKYIYHNGLQVTVTVKNYANPNYATGSVGDVKNGYFI
jgi:hypothetical protein